MTPGRDIDISRRGDCVVARLQGDIDLANVPMILSQITGAVPGDAAGLILDLRDVRYIDSVGIRMLFSLIRKLQAYRQRTAAVVDESSATSKLLKVSALDEAIPVCPSLDEAIAAVEHGESLL